VKAEVELGLAIPFFNEEQAVDRTVADLCAVLDQANICFVAALVDNGSSDGTGAALRKRANRRKGALLVVSLPTNQGYGGGILAGLEAVRAKADPGVVGWMWGDNQVDPEVLIPLLERCRSGAAMAKARRVARQDGWARQVLSNGFAAAMRLRGSWSPDVNGCPKLFRKEALQTLSPTSTDWFLDAEVVLGAERQGWEVAWEPVTMAARTTGQSKVDTQTVLEFARNLLTHRG